MFIQYSSMHFSFILWDSVLVFGDKFKDIEWIVTIDQYFRIVLTPLLIQQLGVTLFHLWFMGKN